MAIIRYKVSALEIAGVEQAYRKQIPLDADNVFFENVDFDADNAQDAIVEAKNTATGFFSQEVLESTSQSNTTSNGWVTAGGWPQTSDPKDAGDYVIDFTAQIGQSDKEKPVGSRVQYRFNGSGSWIKFANSDVRNGLSSDDEFEFRTSFAVLTVPSDGDTIQWRWQFGQTDDGGTGRIRNSAIKITRRA